MFFHNSHFSGPFAQIKWGCAVAWCAFAPPKAIVPTLVDKYHCEGWDPVRSLCVDWAFAKKSVSLKVRGAESLKVRVLRTQRGGGVRLLKSPWGKVLRSLCPKDPFPNKVCKMQS